MLDLNQGDTLYISATSPVSYTITGITVQGVKTIHKVLSQGSITNLNPKLVFTQSLNNSSEITSISVVSRVGTAEVKVFVNGSLSVNQIFTAELEVAYTLTLDRESWKIFNDEGVIVSDTVGYSLTDEQLRASPLQVDVLTMPSIDVGDISISDVTISGTVTTDGSGVTQPISASSLPLPTGAAIAANQQTNALTDSELRANPVPISGSLSLSIDQPLTDTQLRDSPVSVDTGLTPLTNTELRAVGIDVITGLNPLTDTQLRLSPVEVDTGLSPLTDAEIRATPLPISGTVSTGLSPLTDTQLRATPVPISGSLSIDTSSLSTAGNQVDEIALLTTIDSDTSNLDVLLSSRLKPADTLAKVTTVDTITNPVAVTGTFWQATQPVSASSLPLPSGAATSSNQQTDALTDTELRATPVPISGTITTNAGTNLNTSLLALEDGNLASIKADTDKIPALGQALAAASVPVVLTAAQLSTLTPPAAITGYATSANQTTEITSLANLDVALSTRLKAADTLAGVTTVSAVTAITNALPAGTNAIGKLSANSGVDIGDVDVTSIVMPTLTKGTQGSTGLSVQNLKDAGRVSKRFYATAAAAGSTTTETAMTLTVSSQDAATSTAVSFTPTSGKTFRIQAIVFATRGHNTATAQVTTFNLRMNTGGSVTTSSTPILLAMRCATPATANSWDRVYVEIPDGIEIVGDGTKSWGITAAATYSTNAPTWDATVIGYEY